MAAITNGTNLSAQCCQRLEQAVALYVDSFLHGFSLPGSPEFEVWQLAQQEHYQRQGIEALFQLGEHYEGLGEYGEACRCARRALELEPWRESAHRRLMRALALDGRDSDALRHFKACKSLLETELGVPPSPLTEQLKREIETGELRSNVSTVGGTMVQTPRREYGAEEVAAAGAPFVAREAELAFLHSQLTSALAGHGRVAFVRGEAGSGKTMLRTWRPTFWARGCRLSRWCCAHTRFRGRRYPRFREQLETLRRRRPAGGHGPWTDRPRDGTEVSSPSSLPRASNGAIFEQVCRVLFAVASERPLVLLLDNLHWADPYTCGLLFHLGCRLAGTGVPSGRRFSRGRPDPGRRPPSSAAGAPRVAGAVRRQSPRLGRCRPPGLCECLFEPRSQPVGTAISIETLLRFTEGHTLLTVELLHNLQEASGLVRDEDGQWVVTAELDWTTVPPRVEAVIGERIERLPLACRQLLSVASVQGDVFCAEAVAEVLGEDILTVIGSLSDLLGRQHHLVEFHGDRLVGVRRLSRYRFRHHLFRLYVYQALQWRYPARLHHSTAEVLQSWRRTQSAQECVGRDKRCAPGVALRAGRNGA